MRECRVHSILEKRSYIGIAEPCDAAADAGNEELILGMLPGKGDKFVHIGLDGGYRSLHSGNSIRLSLKADSLVC